MNGAALIYNLFPEQKEARFQLANKFSSLGIDQINAPFVGHILNDIAGVDEKIKLLDKMLYTKRSRIAELT